MADPGAPPRKAEFAPSRSLVELVRRERKVQDAADAAPATYHALSGVAGDRAFVEDPLTQRITLRISRMLATLAGMAAARGDQKLYLTRSGRLTEEMCDNVATRLGLDPKESGKVFVQVADELRMHAGKLRGRWGALLQEGEELVIAPRPIEVATQNREGRAKALLGPRTN
jgi:hypothetical protein